MELTLPAVDEDEVREGQAVPQGAGIAPIDGLPHAGVVVRTLDGPDAESPVFRLFGPAALKDDDAPDVPLALDVRDVEALDAVRKGRQVQHVLKRPQGRVLIGGFPFGCALQELTGVMADPLETVPVRLRMIGRDPKTDGTAKVPLEPGFQLGPLGQGHGKPNLIRRLGDRQVKLGQDLGPPFFIDGDRRVGRRLKTGGVVPDELPAVYEETVPDEKDDEDRPPATGRMSDKVDGPAGWVDDTGRRGPIPKGSNGIPVKGGRFKLHPSGVLLHSPLQLGQYALSVAFEEASGRLGVGPVSVLGDVVHTGTRTPPDVIQQTHGIRSGAV